MEETGNGLGLYVGATAEFKSCWPLRRRDAAGMKEAALADLEKPIANLLEPVIQVHQPELTKMTNYARDEAYMGTRSRAIGPLTP